MGQYLYMRFLFYVMIVANRCFEIHKFELQLNSSSIREIWAKTRAFLPASLVWFLLSLLEEVRISEVTWQSGFAQFASHSFFLSQPTQCLAPRWSETRAIARGMLVRLVLLLLRFSWARIRRWGRAILVGSMAWRSSGEEGFRQWNQRKRYHLWDQEGSSQVWKERGGASDRWTPLPANYFGWKHLGHSCVSFLLLSPAPHSQRRVW